MENFQEDKSAQSILSSETLISNHKKQIELSSEGKYTTPTIKALKTRYIALKNDKEKTWSVQPCFFVYCIVYN